MGVFSPASAFSRALIEALVELGVEHAIVSPGSRSQALALELARRDPSPRLHVRIDERVAGFTALGIGKESGRPAIVVCTSGTATGNLLPAVMEASHAAVPLILLTTDRPRELRGTGSNQTTWQPDLYGRFSRFSVDVDAPAGHPGDAARASELARLAVRHALGLAGSREAGPVHINLQFREPLSGSTEGVDPSASELGWRILPREERAADPRRSDEVLALESGPRTVVVAGGDAGAAAEELAFQLRAPLIAEVASGSRYGRNLVAHYRTLLADPELGGRIERVIVFGHPTLSREIPALCAREDVEVVVVTDRPAGPEADVFDPGGRASLFVPGVVVAEPILDDGGWFGAWMTASRAVASTDVEGESPSASQSTEARRDYLRRELAHRKAPVTRESAALAVWAATWPHDRLVLGASRMIRVVDRIATGKKIRVYSNRGLAGIDGTVSSAIGVALASQVESGYGVTRVLLGDVTFLHDVGALLVEDSPPPHVQVVVVNDRGGTIFADLEVAASADPDAFARVMTTPHEVDLASLARAYGWTHTVVSTQSELESAVTGSAPGLSIVEVLVDFDGRVD